MAIRSRVLLCSLILATMAGLGATRLHAQEGDRAAIVEHFKKGVDFYERGRYAEAAAEFDALLRMKPDLQAAIDMRKAVTVDALIKMRYKPAEGPVDPARKALDDQVARILDLVTRATRAQLRDTKEIEKLLADFAKPQFDTYSPASYLLSYHGQYAVPYLLPYLMGPEKKGVPLEQDMTTRALVTLYRMPRSACLPLIQTLKSDDPDLRARASIALGVLGDKRAVPALKARFDDKQEIQSVRDMAGDALKKITGQDAGALAPAADQYYDIAWAYYTGDSKTVDYLYDEVYDVWTWDAKAATPQAHLVAIPVRSYLAYLKEAELNCLAGLALQPDHAGLSRLLLDVYARQLSIVQRLATMGEQPDFGAVAVGQEDVADAKARLPELSWRAQMIFRSASVAALGAALQTALDQGDAPSALLLIPALSGHLIAGTDPAAAEGAKVPADALVSGLSFGDKLVRYASALALLHRAPGGQLGATVPAMQIIATMLTSATSKNALLIVDDLQTRNLLAAELAKLGISTVESTADAGRINNTLLLQPAVDVVFLTANLSGPMFEPVLRNLRNDPRTKLVPIFLVIDPKAAGDKVDPQKQQGVAGVIETDLILEEYLKKVVVDPYLSKPSPTAAGKEQETFILQGLEAVAPIDPLGTKYELTRYLESPLGKALLGRSDEVKLLTLECLAKLGTKLSVQPLLVTITSKDSVPVRSAALLALGQICKRGAIAPDEKTKDAVQACLQDEAEQVRIAAAEALGLMGLSPAEWLKTVQGVQPSIK